jgi:hypothetical protein
MPSNNNIYKMSNAGGFKSLNRYYDMLAGNATFVENSYESISTVTVGAGGVSSITFSSIPSTYQHLQIRYIARGSFAGASQEFYLRYNGSSANYNGGHYLYGEGTGVSVGKYAYSTVAVLEQLVAATSTASVFNGGVIDVLDYTNTNKYKTHRSLGGYDANGSGYIYVNSSLWMDTAAVSSITMLPSTGNFAQYSSFALYGISG